MRVSRFTQACAMVSAAWAGGASAADQGVYDLVMYGSSRFVHDRCLPPCACPQSGEAGAVGGGFRVRLVNIGDVFDLYAVENIDWTVRAGSGEWLHVTGSGQYRRSEIAHLQMLHLDLSVTPNVGAVTLDSGIVALEDAWPVLRVDIPGVQVGCERSALRLVAGLPATCAVDLDDGRGFGVPDGGVDVSDLVYFLGGFESGNAAVDLSGGPCGCIECVCPDGGVDIEDLLFFLRRFERGC